VEAIFSLSSVLVLPFWLLIIALPHWRWTRRLVASPLIVVPPAILYALLVGPQLATVFPVVMRPTLASVAALLATPEGATLAWAHFLAFDLFVGRWAYLDSQERGVSAWLMAAVLFLTLMLGPVGLLLHLLVRVLTPARHPAPVLAATQVS
jgi:Domain of unknown function (DUF4281)